MANVYGYTRSSFFRVKNEQTFRDWAEQWQINVLDHGYAGFSISAPDDPNEYHQWPPAHECNANCDDDCTPDDSFGNIALSFLQGLSAQIEDGTIVLLFQAYTEKVFLCSVEAIAVHSDGRHVNVKLDDAIWRRAARTFRDGTTLFEKFADELAYTEAMLEREEQIYQFAMDGSVDLDDYEVSLDRSIEVLTQHISAVREHLARVHQHKVAGLLTR